MRDRASLVLVIFIILIVIILAQNGTLGTLLSSFSDGSSGLFSITAQPAASGVRPVIFSTPVRAPIFTTPALPTAYAPGYAAQPAQPVQPAQAAPVGVVGAGGQCIAPNGWVAYTVQSGETLAVIASYYNLTAADLAAANCLQNPDLIYVGQVLAVPSVR